MKGYLEQFRGDEKLYRLDVEALRRGGYNFYKQDEYVVVSGHDFDGVTDLAVDADTDQLYGFVPIQYWLDY